MAVSHSDQYLLGTDPTFQTRVQASLASACIAISNEGWGVVFHRERSNFVNDILQNPFTPKNYIALFSGTVATDASVISDATAAGTVAITTANLAARAALVTDAHIDSAISSQFNSFIRVPNN